MANAIPAPGSKGYSAADILRLAREHNVPGELVKAARGGRRETRRYAVEGSVPAIISAGRDQHFIGEERRAPVALVTPTPLNIWVLGRLANGRREFPNRIRPTSRAALRRCMDAGLVEPSADNQRLIITEAGRQAIGDAIATRGERFPLPEGPFTTEICE